MSRAKSAVLRSALDALYYSGGHRLFGSAWRGVGAILTLHHVRPQAGRFAFCPNRILDITPEFLETAVQTVRRAGYEIVSMDELVRRLTARRFERKFVAFTLDDGYRDNFIHALPIFERYEIPFTVYVASGLPEGGVVLWWEILEQLIRDHPRIEIECGGQWFTRFTETVEAKYRAYDAIYWTLRKLPHSEQWAAIQRLIDYAGVDWRALCRSSAMTWDTLRALAAHPLATLGAHTLHHHALDKLEAEVVREEVHAGRALIEQMTGLKPVHFAYPYGDFGSAGPREFDIIRDLGFASATTTRKGVLFPEHAGHLHALPRVSLNGDYQRARYVALFLSGAPFALWNRFRRVNVA